MKSRRNFDVASLVTSPASVISPGSNWMYASMEFISGELQNARMLRKCVCAMAVPILPGDAPIIADGFRVNEFFPYGRLAQSIAFFNPPGIDRLYSGVTNSTASTFAMASLKAVAAGGNLAS